MRTYRALMLGLLLALPATAPAADLSIRFHGSFSSGVCQLTLPDVDLGSYGTAAFTGSHTTPWVPVVIQSSGCDPAVTGIDLGFTGPADANVATLFEGLDGIGIEFRTRDTQTPILPTGTRVVFATVSGTTSYPFQARLSQSATTVASGVIRTPVVVSVMYL
jgi:type 1 fimbria pilin